MLSREATGEGSYSELSWSSVRANCFERSCPGASYGAGKGSWARVWGSCDSSGGSWCWPSWSWGPGVRVRLRGQCASFLDQWHFVSLSDFRFPLPWQVRYGGFYRGRGRGLGTERQEDPKLCLAMAVSALPSCAGWRAARSAGVPRRTTQLARHHNSPLKAGRLLCADSCTRRRPQRSRGRWTTTPEAGRRGRRICNRRASRTT